MRIATSGYTTVAIIMMLCTVTVCASHAQTHRILVQSGFAAGLRDLSERYPNLEIVSAGSSSQILEQIPECDALVGVYTNVDLPAIVRAGKKLKWIQSMSAGVAGFVGVPELRDSDILLTNAKIIQGPEIADHALGLLLNLTRDLKSFNAQMASGFSRRNRLPLIELRGKTVLIIGLGGIGTQTAERCAAFGMRVLAVDPKDIPYMNAVERVVKPDEFEALLPECDVIISCAPRTPESEGMLGPKQFELMKDGVYIINVSRGAIIDTEALTAALKSGKVRAAGLDVTEPEPLPKDHPLWSMPNVTITPHIAGMSDVIQERRIALFRDNIVRFIEGRPMRNVVDKKKGY